MIMIHISKCPNRLRGDLTKWLYRIGSGLYVGDVNARIREYLWSRIVDNVENGSAIMAYDSDTESGLAIRLHGTGFSMRDYDGLPVPFIKSRLDSDESIDSTGEQVLWRARRRSLRSSCKTSVRKFAFIDIETTGLNVFSDAIIEVGVLPVDDGVALPGWSSLVTCDTVLPVRITKLTGISEEMSKDEGIDISAVLDSFLDFIQGRQVMCYNQGFDVCILDRDLISLGKTTINGVCPVHDVMVDVKRYFNSRDGPESYKLEVVAKWFGVDTTGSHRALRDCQILYEVWTKVNENRDS